MQLSTQTRNNVYFCDVYGDIARHIVPVSKKIYVTQFIAQQFSENSFIALIPSQHGLAGTRFNKGDIEWRQQGSGLGIYHHLPVAPLCCFIVQNIFLHAYTSNQNVLSKFPEPKRLLSQNLWCSFLGSEHCMYSRLGICAYKMQEMPTLQSSQIVILSKPGIGFSILNTRNSILANVLFPME